MRINWEPVNDNSSSEDAVATFAKGWSLAHAESMAWDPRVKKIFRQLRRLPVRLARERARAWCRRSLLTW